MIDRNLKLSDVDKSFGTLPKNIAIDTVILAAQDIIYRNRKKGGTLAMGPVRRKLYNQIIKENILSKFSSDKYNLQKMLDSIKDDICNL